MLSKVNVSDSKAPTSPTTAEQYTQTRIRVNQDGGELLWRLVLAEETRLLTARRQIDEEHIAIFQADLKALRRVKDEIERGLIDMGWID